MKDVFYFSDLFFVLFCFVFCFCFVSSCFFSFFALPQLLRELELGSTLLDDCETLDIATL